MERNRLLNRKNLTGLLDLTAEVLWLRAEGDISRREAMAVINGYFANLKGQLPTRHWGEKAQRAKGKHPNGSSRGPGRYSHE